MEETKLRQLFKNRADAYLNTIDESVEQGMSEDCFIKAVSEAINYTHCCKSDSELLSNLKNKLSFRQWKEVNNYRLTGNDLVKKGNLTFTEPEVFEQYKKYLSEIA
jgi:hypothetical protein